MTDITTDKAVGPLFTYPGSKANLAQWIIEMMPVHDVYVEPFAGTLAVLLYKPESPIEIVNDLDGDLVNFYRVLRDQPDELIRRCELTPFSRTEFEEARMFRDAGATIDPVERAREWWLLKAFSINGKGQTLVSSANADRVGNVRTFISRMRETARRLNNAVIENEDAIDLIARMDSPTTLHYCDPPYLGSTRTSSVYEVEMASLEDHERFARVVNDCKGYVMISGYPSPYYDEMFPLVENGGKWYQEKKNVLSTLGVVTAGTTGGKEVVEVVYANFPIYGKQNLF